MRHRSLVTFEAVFLFIILNILLFYLIALLVTSNAAHRLNERVAGVINPCLDALVKGPVVGGQLVPKFSINGWSQSRGHAVIVFPQVREVRALREKGWKTQFFVNQLTQFNMFNNQL